MKNKRLAIFLTSAIMVASAGFLQAQGTSGQATRRAFLLDTFKAYEISTGRSPSQRKTVKLNRKPLHYFSNPISGVVDAAVFAWESDGHPQAIGKIFVNEKKQAWGEYIASLSESRLEMEKSGRPLWRPVATEFKKLDDFPRPSKNSNARKVQMRSIAGQFEVIDLWKEDGLISDEAGTDWSLRMLAKPLIRYGSQQSKVIDGGIFGFVQGTNPEAILTIEAFDAGDEPHWRYRFSRLTIYELRAKRKNKLVWSVPRSMVSGDLSYHGWHPFASYPFDKSAPLTNATEDGLPAEF